MFWNRRRPHQDSKSNGLKSFRAGLGGSTQTAGAADADTGVLVIMLSTGLGVAKVEALLLLASALPSSFTVLESYGFCATRMFHAAIAEEALKLTNNKLEN